MPSAAGFIRAKTAMCERSSPTGAITKVELLRGKKEKRPRRCEEDGWVDIM